MRAIVRSGMRVAALATLAVALAPAAAPAGPAAGFWDPGFASGAVRTEHAPAYGTSSRPVALRYGGDDVRGAEGCLWDAAASFAGCPGRAGMGRAWAGTLQGREACGGDPTRAGDTWRGCTTFARDTYFAANDPGARYWVVHANNDPSFDQCRDGAPGVSQRIVDLAATPKAPGLFKVGMRPRTDAGRTLEIVVAPSEHDFRCGEAGTLQYAIPYLSVGAHRTRGNGTAVALVDRARGTGADVVRFRARIESYEALGCRAGTDSICTARTSGAHTGVLLVAHWGGVRRMLFLDLYAVGSTDHAAAPVRARWNWPLADSMFWPGGEVVILSARSLSRDCAMTVAPLVPGSPGPWRDYAIPLTVLFACASDRGLFSAPLPAGPVEVEAIDWYVEASGTAGRFGLAVRDARVAGR